MRSVRGAAVVGATLVVCATAAHAQVQQRFYAEGALTGLTQALPLLGNPNFHEEFDQPTWGGTVMIGERLTPLFSIEFEASFGDALTGTFTYSPSPSFPVREVDERRDDFYTVQLRGRLGAIEPVFGVGWVHESLHRHATVVQTFGSYFDDNHPDGAMSISFGADIAFPIGTRVDVVPTFRCHVAPMLNQIDRPLLFQYGAGVRVKF